MRRGLTDVGLRPRQAWALHALRVTWAALLLFAASGPGVSGAFGVARPSGEARPRATILPPDFVDELVVGGLPLITSMAWAPDGRIFLAVKAGRVLIYEAGAILPTPFIDISAEVNNWADRGLNGMALHPDFPATPYVYLWYTYDPPDLPATNPASSPDGTGGRASRLVRVSADPANPNQALPNSEFVVLGTNSTLANMGGVDVEGNGPPPYPAPGCQQGGQHVPDCFPADSQSHSTGQLRFGTDGALYVGHGDGSGHILPDYRALRALDVNSLAGKMLRVDPETGLGLPSNPFYDGDPASNRSRVIALGLRNPYRFALRGAGQDLYIGDVGWGTWEEVNTGFGANFGWPCYEGPEVQPGYATHPTTAATCQAYYGLGASQVTPPLYAYPMHPVYRGAVIVGEFYQGLTYPAEYHGLLFFADFTNNWIKTLDHAPNGTVTVTDFLQRPQGAWNGPVQLTQGPDGNLYYVTVAEWGSEVRRIRYTAGANLPPVAQLSASPTNGGLPLVVSFSAAGSVDPEGQPLTYAWAFGDGSLAAGLAVTHTYTLAGNYTAVLTVTDSLAASSVRQVMIAAGNHAPVASITAPLTGTLFAVGDLVEFAGTGTDVEDGDLSGAALQWTMLLHHHLHIHPDGLPPTSGASGSFPAPDHDDNTWMELCLTATDSGGLSATACRPLWPATVPLGLRSLPSGLQVVYAGTARATPFDVAVQVGAERSVAALTPQLGRVFMGWSNGGDSSQALTLTVPTVLTVTYAFENPNYTWFPIIHR